MEDNQEEDLECTGHNWLCAQGEVNGLVVYHQSGVSRHLSGASGALLINTISGAGTQMGFQISYEAWPRWNPFTIFMMLYVHHSWGSRCSLDNALDDRYYLRCPLHTFKYQSWWRLCVCVTANKQPTIFWQDSSTLHYYAENYHSSTAAEKMREPKKLSGLPSVARGGWMRVEGYALIILKGLFHLMGKDEMWGEINK